jgi:hypothetical protein
MSPSLRLTSRICLPPWRVCVSALLVLLVIYNPFTALNGSSSALSYETLARNRASIGASELEHFSPVPNPEIQPDLEVDLRGVELAPSVEEQERSGDQREVIASEPELLAGAWFRPPPSQ